MTTITTTADAHFFCSIWGLESPKNPVVTLEGAEDKMNSVRHLEDISRTQIPEVSASPQGTAGP